MLTKPPRRVTRRLRRPVSGVALVAPVTCIVALPHQWPMFSSQLSSTSPPKAVRQAPAEIAPVHGQRPLGQAAARIWELLAKGTAPEIEGLPEDLHELPAGTPMSEWQELGRLLTQQECPDFLNSSTWVSLRLDGVCWSELFDRLRQRGVVKEGYGAEFGEAMQASCRAVMDEFNAVVGYTHSDEMTFLLAPVGQRCDNHQYNGRLQKWVSIAGSMATAVVNRKLFRLQEAHGIEPDESLVAHFDCRVGSFDTEAEAVSLILWRAYQCSMSSVQDACMLSGAPADVQTGHLEDKLRWLADNGLLPMDRHQAYGSLFAKGLAEFDVFVEERNETVRVNRSVDVLVNDGLLDQMPMNLLNFPARGLPICPREDDPRMEVRPGSYWRYSGVNNRNFGRHELRRLPSATRQRKRKRRWSLRGKDPPAQS